MNYVLRLIKLVNRSFTVWRSIRERDVRVTTHSLLRGRSHNPRPRDSAIGQSPECVSTLPHPDRAGVGKQLRGRVSQSVAPTHAPTAAYCGRAYRYCALLAGLFALFFIGSLLLNAELPIAGKWTVQAGAGFALFVVVLFWWQSPAALIHRSPDQPKSSTSSGPSQAASQSPPPAPERKPDAPAVTPAKTAEPPAKSSWDLCQEGDNSACAKVRDDVLEKCEDRSSIECQRRVQCWEDQSRAQTLLNSACGPGGNPQQCAFFKQLQTNRPKCEGF